MAVKIPCPPCSGTGTIDGQTCGRCGGSGELDADWYRGISERITDMEDALTDIMNKCNDIFEKVSE